MRKFFLFILFLLVGFGYDYLINVDKNVLVIHNISYKNVSYDILINLDKRQILLIPHRLFNVSYDFLVNLDYINNTNVFFYKLNNLSYDFFVNLDKRFLVFKYNQSFFNYDFFVLLNKSSLIISNFSIVLISPENNKTYFANEVLFKYKVINYTGVCSLVLDLDIVNTTNISLSKNTVSIKLNVSNGVHTWFVICNNTVSEQRVFYVKAPVIEIYSPSSKELEGAVKFDVQVKSSEDNVSSYLEVYDLKNNKSVAKIPFSSKLIYYLNLNSGNYKLVVYSNVNGISLNKSKIFSVLKYSGSFSTTPSLSTPENNFYIIVILIVVIFLFLRNKTKYNESKCSTNC